MKRMVNRILPRFMAVFAVMGVLVFSGCSPAEEDHVAVEISISAAASMTDALQEINALYMQENSWVTLSVNFASSGTLQKQIENGAPVDVFISAAPAQMNALEEGGFLVDSSRRNLLNNKIVLIVPADSTLGLDSFMDLLDSGVVRIALGDPEFVPAGTYGKKALEILGIYDQLLPKLILGSDVRQVLGYVEGANVEAGIVYSTDAAITDGVVIVAEAPAEVNPLIVSPAAIIKGCQDIEAAQAYIDFLFGQEAAAIFAEYGFSLAEG